jgi:DNA-binding SARP family transcriptional activator
VIVESDLQRFLECSRESGIENARLGVGLYGGEFLAGERAEWVIPIRVRCAALYCAMLEKLGVHAYEIADFAAALNYALQIVEYDRAHESASRLVMRSFAALGQRSSANAEFIALKQFLSKHLGVDPSQESAALIASIMAGERP